MRISITCEVCGHHHRLARTVSRCEPIRIICHSCETPLRADPTPALYGPAAGAPHPALRAWAGIFDRLGPDR